VRSVLGKALLGVAFVACPCHLPIYGALLAGTALGSSFAEHRVLALVLLTAAFVLSLAAGLRMIRSRGGSPSRL